MIDAMEFFGIYFVKYCKLFYTDLSALPKYRKSRMMSGVSGSSTHHAILRHGEPSFFWLMGRMVTRDSIRPCEQRLRVVRIYKHPAWQRLGGLMVPSFGRDNLIFARVHLSARRLKLFLALRPLTHIRVPRG